MGLGGPWGENMLKNEQSYVYSESVNGVRVLTREVLYQDKDGREKGYIISENGAKEAGIHPSSRPRGTPGFGAVRRPAIQLAF